MNRLAIFLLTIVLVSPASAGADDGMTTRMWQRHSAGVNKMLDCFLRSAPADEYGQHALAIVSAETNLLAYGISPKHERLVSSLAYGTSSSGDFPVLAYRIFKKQFKEVTGFTPTPHGSFAGTFHIQALEKTDAVGFVNITFKSEGVR